MRDRALGEATARLRSLVESEEATARPLCDEMARLSRRAAETEAAAEEAAAAAEEAKAHSEAAAAASAGGEEAAACAAALAAADEAERGTAAEAAAAEEEVAAVRPKLAAALSKVVEARLMLITCLCEVGAAWSECGRRGGAMAGHYGLLRFQASPYSLTLPRLAIPGGRGLGAGKGVV